MEAVASIVDANDPALSILILGLTQVLRNFLPSSKSSVNPEESINIMISEF